MVKATKSLTSDLTLSNILKTKDNNFLDITELSLFECKENFNVEGKSLIRTLCAFANNKGGYILYGIKDAT